MRLNASKRGMAWRLLIIPILAFGSVFISISPKSAFALSVYDYFVITYDTEFNKSGVQGNEIFYATVDGTATCKSDLPLTVSEGHITSRIIAQHRRSGAKVTLNSSYTITIDPFPNQNGETTQAFVVIPLKFPTGSQPGIYNVVAELVRAEVRTATDPPLSIPVTSFLPSSQTMGSVSYLPEDKDEEVIIVGPVFDLAGWTDEYGYFIGDFIFESDDGMCQLSIDKGTIGLTKDGEPLSELTILRLEDPPAPPTGYTIIGHVYHLSPDGAIFNPRITLILTYKESLIPEGVAEDDLVIAIREESGWVILEGSMVAPETNTITAPLGHFNAVAILAPTPHPKPATFTITDLLITPKETNIGQEITISALITNVGDLEGTYPLTLKINDIVEATGDISLAGGCSRRVTFTIKRNVAGVYTVNVNGRQSTFRVKASPSAITPSEAPTAPTSPPSPSVISPTKTSGWLVGSIIAAVAIGITVPLVLRRRRRRFNT